MNFKAIKKLMKCFIFKLRFHDLKKWFGGLVAYLFFFLLRSFVNFNCHILNRQRRWLVEHLPVSLWAVRYDIRNGLFGGNARSKVVFFCLFSIPSDFNS